MSDRNQKHSSGRLYWQSLTQLADTPEVAAMIENEFAGYDPKAMVSLPRRRFLKLMGASMALAGVTLTGCRRWPKERLAPYSSAVRDRLPGVPEQYATTMELGGVAMGLLATAYDGRPIKIEGNPSHPASATFGGKLGSADVHAQASVLELYDPDRSRFVVDRSGSSPRESNFDEFHKALGDYLAANCPGGAGFAIVSEASDGPSVQATRKALLAAMPQAQWYEYEPVSFDNEHGGIRAATGQAGRSVLKLDEASVVVSLDCDFLGTHPNHTRYSNDWVKLRRSADAADKMSRLYVAESTFTITGTNADERLQIKPSQSDAIAVALATKLGLPSLPAVSLDGDAAAFVENAAKDLEHAGKAGVVTVGPQGSWKSHVLAYLINQKLGAVGATVNYVQVPDRPSHAKAIDDLTKSLNGGGVKALLIIGGNPAFDAPVDMDFATAIGRAPLSAHLSYYLNETSLACKWHANKAHYLEAWGDGRSWDGTVATAQPLIEPIFGGKSAIEVLARLAKLPQTDGESIVRASVGKLTNDNSEAGWRKIIHDGVVPNSAYPAITAGRVELPKFDISAPAAWEVRFIPHCGVYDGRFANLGWLVELPDPITKLTWDNSAWISKKDADAMGIREESKDGKRHAPMLRLTIANRTLELPAYIVPGHPSGVVTLQLGFGRTAAGMLGGLEAEGVAPCGFNVYTLRGSDGMTFAPAASVEKAGGTYILVSTSDHFLIDDVGFKGMQARVGSKGRSGKTVLEATFAQYVAHHRDPHVFAPPDSHGKAPLLQIFEEPKEGKGPQKDPGAPDNFNHPHAWGMSIDMNACIGCSACVVACQAENNIPTVGKENVAVNREMHWLRIDRYFKTAGSTVEEAKNDPNPQVVHMPMMCVQCENAPCEQVCPVAATVHDTEGLNTMVYNRCIGTRYCSNNCPYKVRRFNYFDWHSNAPRSGRYKNPWPWMPDSQQKYSVDPLRAMGFNPEVSVRMRGVMEKCNYCTQRIAAAKIAARNAWKQGHRDTDLVKDGEIITACQQACPTEAIVFGDLNDANSAVRKLHALPRAYALLDELNSRPRTRHLAKLRNPAAEVEHAGQEHGHT